METITDSQEIQKFVDTTRNKEPIEQTLSVTSTTVPDLIEKEIVYDETEFKTGLTNKNDKEEISEPNENSYNSIENDEISSTSISSFTQKYIGDDPVHAYEVGVMCSCASKTRHHAFVNVPHGSLSQEIKERHEERKEKRAFKKNNKKSIGKHTLEYTKEAKIISHRNDIVLGYTLEQLFRRSCHCHLTDDKLLKTKFKIGSYGPMIMIGLSKANTRVFTRAEFPLLCSNRRGIDCHIIDITNPNCKKFMQAACAMLQCGMTFSSYDGVVWWNSQLPMLKRIEYFYSYMLEGPEEGWCNNTIMKTSFNAEKMLETFIKFFTNLIGKDTKFSVLSENIEGNFPYSTAYILIEVPSTKELYLVIRSTMGTLSGKTNFECQPIWVPDIIPDSNVLRHCGGCVYLCYNKDHVLQKDEIESNPKINIEPQNEIYSSSNSNSNKNNSEEIDDIKKSTKTENAVLLSTQVKSKTKQTNEKEEEKTPCETCEYHSKISERGHFSLQCFHSKDWDLINEKNPDLPKAQCSYSNPYNPDNNWEVVHGGMYRAAAIILEKIKPILEKYNEKGYKLYMTGHSQGSGVGAIMTYLLYKYKVWPIEQRKRYIGIFGGMPCCVSSKISDILRDKASLVSITSDFDLVPRMNMLGLSMLMHRASGSANCRECISSVYGNDLKITDDIDYYCKCPKCKKWFEKHCKSAYYGFEAYKLAMAIAAKGTHTPLFAAGEQIVCQTIEKENVNRLIHNWKGIEALGKNKINELQEASKQSAKSLGVDGYEGKFWLNNEISPDEVLSKRYGAVQPKTSEDLKRLLTKQGNYVFHVIGRYDAQEIFISEDSALDHANYRMGCEDILWNINKMEKKQEKQDNVN